MRIHATLVMLLLSTFVLILWGGSAKSVKTPFTCQAGNFMIGQPGFVICHFGHDIYNSKYDFEIVKLPFNASPNSIGDDILRCNREDEQPVCATREGFSFNGDLQENLKICILNVTRDVEGKYACQLIPADNRKKDFCELTVKETIVEQPNPPTTEMHPVCSPEKGQDQGLLVWVVLLSVALFANSVVIIFLLCSNRRLKNNIRQHENADIVVSSSTPLLRDGEPERVDILNNERPSIMPAIRPYNNDDAEQENRIDIQSSVLKSRPVTITGKRPYNDFDNKRNKHRTVLPTPIPFVMPVIRPYNENDDDEGEEKLIDPPIPPSPIGGTRRPFRRPCHRHA